MTEQSQPIGHNPSDDKAHPNDTLRFEEIVIFYNLVFDIGAFVNPTDIARKLLDTDFALSAPNYLTEDIEVASRFKELADLKILIQALSKIQEHQYKAGVAEVFTWVLQHPTQTWRMLQKSKRTNPHHQFDQNDEYEDKSETKESTRDVLRFLDESIMRIQFFEALQRHVDRELFAPQYLNEIPFTRIGLQPFFAKMAGEDIDVDVGVLIHRTGIAILTFYVVFKGQKTIDDVVKIQNSTTSVERLEVVRSFTEVSSITSKPSETRYSSGVEWFIYQNLKKITFADIFGLYQTAILSAIKGKKPKGPGEPWSWLRCPIWLYYPVVFLRHIIPEIDSNSNIKERYPKELAGIVMRFPRWKSLKDDKAIKEINEDQSIMKDYSLYIESSHATVLYYEPYREALIEKFGDDIPSQEWISRFLYTSSVIDVLLIQRWTLTMLDYLISNISKDEERLNDLKRKIILGLEDYYRITLSHGSAQEIITNGKIKMGISGQYENLLRKLNNIESLITVEETRRRTQRDFLLKSGTAFAAIMFGLVGAWRTVEIIRGWDELLQSVPSFWRFFLEPVVQLARVHSIAVTLCLYFVSIAIIVALFIWSIWPSRNSKPIINIDQSQSAYKPGFKWDTHIEIIKCEGDNVPNNTQEPK